MSNGTGSGNLGGVTVRGQRHPDSYAGYETWELFLAWYESLLNEDGELVVEEGPIGEDDLIPLTPELAEYISAILALEQDPEFTKLSEELRQKIYKDPELTKICRDVFVGNGIIFEVGGNTTASYLNSAKTIYVANEQIFTPGTEVFERNLLILAHEIYHAGQSTYATTGFRREEGEAYATVNSVEFMFRVGLGMPSGAIDGSNSGQANQIAGHYMAGEFDREEALQRIENLPWN